MSEGLTRRRGAGAATARTSGEGFDRSASGGAGGGSSSRPESRVAETSPVSGAVESRNKVAYDPRDFSDDNESKSTPRLTLMEEVLLLGLKDKAVRTRWLLSASPCTGKCCRCWPGIGTNHRRATSHSGTTTSPTHFEDVSLLSLRCDDVSPWSVIRQGAD